MGKDVIPEDNGEETLSRIGFHTSLELSCRWDFPNGKILRSDLSMTGIVYVCWWENILMEYALHKVSDFSGTEPDLL